MFVPKQVALFIETTSIRWLPGLEDHFVTDNICIYASAALVLVVGSYHNGLRCASVAFATRL